VIIGIDMTKFTLIPIHCKVLRIYYSKMCYNGYCDKSVLKDKEWVVGKYFVAEHSKTPGLEEGDSFIIKEIYAD
jgi:hypothetical protein